MPLLRVAIYTDSFTFKMTKVEFELLTDTEKLLMVLGVEYFKLYINKVIMNVWRTMIQGNDYHFLCTGM